MLAIAPAIFVLGATPPTIMPDVYKRQSLLRLKHCSRRAGWYIPADIRRPVPLQFHIRLSLIHISKAQVLQKPEGLLKAIVDDESGLILGAHLFCEESHEMINLIKLAIDAVSYTHLPA